MAPGTATSAHVAVNYTKPSSCNELTSFLDSSPSLSGNGGETVLPTFKDS